MFAALRRHPDAGRAGWHLPGLAAGVTPQSNSEFGVDAVEGQRSHHVDVARYSASNTTWLGGYRVLAATVLNCVCSWLRRHGSWRAVRGGDGVTLKLAASTVKMPARPGQKARFWHRFGADAVKFATLRQHLYDCVSIACL